MLRFTNTYEKSEIYQAWTIIADWLTTDFAEQHVENGKTPYFTMIFLMDNAYLRNEF